MVDHKESDLQLSDTNRVKHRMFIVSKTSFVQ